MAAYLDSISEDISVKKPKKLKISESDEESRLAYLRSRYENFYNDAILIGSEEFNFSDHKMRRRDWNILTSNSSTISFAKGEMISFPSQVSLLINY